MLHEPLHTILRENYEKYLSQGMDDFEAKHRAVQHIVQNGNFNLTKEDIHRRWLNHLYDKKYVKTLSLEEQANPPIRSEDWIDQYLSQEEIFQSPRTF